MAHLRRLATLVLFLAGCSGSHPMAMTDAGHDTPRDANGGFVRCGPGDDVDQDTISTEDEGTGDADSDGTPNAQDTDSDGDTILDFDEAGDHDCVTHPLDSDSDGTPDFLDRDANADGVDDAMQVTVDTDHDGIPDWREDDVDDDGIPNVIEYTDPANPGVVPADTDSDGTPDVFDVDSDGDTIPDSVESSFDTDRDGTPNFRDLDSDGDGVDDAIEAGDGDLDTPPRICPNEINPLTGEVAADGFADWADRDSDNDGLGDGEEVSIGTDPCGIDSDGDGVDDLAEGAYEIYCREHTPTEMCDIATNTSAQIPSEHFYVVLPYMGPPVERDLDFGTTIRVADVFFLTDFTGSMSGVLSNVEDTVARPGTGLIARISDPDTGIPDAWFGGGGFQDMPFGGYGGSGDQPFYLAIQMTSPDRGADVAAAFSRISASGGSDGPEAHTEGLYQTLTGEGGTWMGSGSPPTYTMRHYAGDCLDMGWGAPCFREAALPIIVMFSDICGHEGPPGEDASCDHYTGITPAPHTWMEAIAAMNTRGAKFIGIGTSGNCATTVGPDGFSPCYYMKRTAEETGSVDLDGIPLVYNLPASGATELFADTIVNAIETVAHRVPLDVDTGLRDYPADTVNATRFIKRRQPACRAIPPAPRCWEEDPASGLSHDEAVAFVDESTFFGVIPGTRVTFRITFQNDFQPGGATAEVFIAFIDVRGGGSAILDTREVFVVVPAGSDINPG